MKAKSEMKGGLCLKRRLGESVYIFVNGEQVKIDVREIKGYVVTLGIDGDREKVAIFRDEHWKEEG